MNESDELDLFICFSIKRKENHIKMICAAIIAFTLNVLTQIIRPLMEFSVASCVCANQIVVYCSLSFVSNCAKIRPRTMN